MTLPNFAGGRLETLKTMICSEVIGRRGVNTHVFFSHWNSREKGALGIRIAYFFVGKSVFLDCCHAASASEVTKTLARFPIRRVVCALLNIESKHPVVKHFQGLGELECCLGLARIDNSQESFLCNRQS